MKLGQNRDVLRNLMIVANAGSGKTYRLCLRYIELLTRGFSPERLVALTFTRKAAGEFIDRIFCRLAEAASSPSEAMSLTHELGISTLPHSALFSSENLPDGSAKLRSTNSRAPHAAVRTPHSPFLHSLRSVTDKLHQLNLGTIDSFLFRILSSFPFECGLGAVPEILTDFQADRYKQQAFEAAFDFRELSPSEREHLIALVRKQQRGYFKRSMASSLANLWKMHYPMLDQGVSASWGDLPPDVSSVGLTLSESEFFTRLEKLQTQAEGQCDSHAFIFLNEQIEWLINSYRMERLHEKSATLIERLPTLDKSGDIVRVRSKRALEFPIGIWLELEILLLAAAQRELNSIAEASQAAQALIQRVAAHYDQLTRQSGRLTFSQITALTAELSRETAASTGSLLHQIAYRLDAFFDHWLLDEFQDTSRQQWEALSQFVDEVLQSDSGDRSLFYVGDTKQAIYTWRGGDPSLFFHIRDHYNQHHPLIQEEDLTVSYRSSPIITEAVNQIFGNLSKASPSIPSTVLEIWQQAWRNHEAFYQDRSGYFSCQLLEAPKETARGKEDLREAALQLLREIEPSERGWECAILVQSNSEVEAYVNLLLASGIKATGEGHQFLRDGSQLVEIISSALRVVINPNDRFSLIHLQSTPLAASKEMTGGRGDGGMGRKGLRADDRGLTAEKNPQLNTFDFRESALCELYEHGLPHLLRSWIEQLGELDSFNQQRADWLLALAEEYSRSKDSITLADFVKIIDLATRRDTSGSQTVKVMTIHSAKGLTFDMVILPDLKEYHRSSLGWLEPQTALSGKNNETSWTIPYPGKELCALNPHLQQAADTASAQAFYENLCKYYVAITRPRHAAYLLGRRPSNQSKVTDFVAILQSTLLGDRDSYTSGDPQWYKVGSRKSEVGSVKNDCFAIGKVDVVPTSTEDEIPTSRGKLPVLSIQIAKHTFNTSHLPLPTSHFPFDFNRKGAQQFGTTIHRILCNIEWLDTTALENQPDFARLPLNWRTLLHTCLDTPTIQPWFRKPTNLYALWREQSFAVHLDNAWVHGRFDRVLIHSDDDGTPTRATLLDFKTDSMPVESLTKHYCEQLALYRQALEHLFPHPLKSIDAYLISIHHAKAIAI